MTTAYTSLLGLALPVTGELSGTWGDTVNNSITSLLDSAVAGTQTLTADTTLTTTTGAANQSRQAILLCSPASANITITAPAQSKIYTVINTSGTYTVTVRGVGPTTGVTLGVSEKAVVAWNGSDFVKISNTTGDGTFANLTVTGNTTLGNADTDTITQSASYVTGTQLKSAKTATNTLSLAAYDVDGAAYTNLITLTASNTPTLALTSTGVGTINNMSIGATTTSTGAFTTLSATGAVTANTTTNNQSYTTTGAGTITISSGTAGTINNMSIGATTALAGTFTDLTSTGNTSIGNADTDTITQAASYVTGTQLKSAKTATNTLNIAAYDTEGAAYTNFITLTASTTPTLALTSTGVGTINNMSVGATTASTGAFTTLTSNGATTFTAGTASTTTGTGTLVITGGLGVSGRINAANFDGIVGANTAAAGTFTTLSSTGNTTIGDAVADTITVNGQFVTGTVLRSAQTATNTLALAAYDTDGAAYTNLITLTASTTPTLALTSTGVGTINNMSVGATTASTGAFTTLSASSTVSGTGFSTYLASPPAIGGTAAAAGAFTTLSASSTVSGTGFSTYLASPPAIGGTAAAAGTFTTLSSTGNTTIGDADTDTITVNGQFVTGTQLKSAKTATNTLNLAAYDTDGAAYTNLITLTASTTPTLALTSTGVGTINNMSIGATTTSTGSFTSLAYSTTLTGGTGIIAIGTNQIYKDAAGKVGIGTASPAVTLAVSATDAVLVPVGTTAQRPTGASGYLRFNSTITQFEGFNGTVWSSVGGGATGGGADQVFIENSLIVTTNYTITTGKNAMSTGPITINSGVTVTIPTGARWVVL